MAKLQKFFEYLNNENTFYLYKYLKTSEEDLIESLPYEYSYLIEDYFSSMDVDPTDKLGDMEPYEYVDYLFEEDKEVFGSFAKWLFDGVNSRNLGIPDAEYPSWSFLTYRGIHKPNEWLLHFTTHSAMHDILKLNKFSLGTQDMTKLGLTTHYSDESKKYGGYNFGYSIQDAIQYNRSAERYGDGESIIMFKASGVKAWHSGDEEYQTIFDGSSVRDMTGLTKNYAGDWVIFGYDDLIKKENWWELAKWIEKNYDQYRKMLQK
jgi:hypothetical protein